MIKVTYHTTQGPKVDEIENGDVYSVDDKNNLIINSASGAGGRAMYASGCWTSVLKENDAD